MSRRPGPPAAHRRRRAASLGFVFYIAASSAAIYPLSLHDALPISYERRFLFVGTDEYQRVLRAGMFLDRKSTRLNSSHRCISYAVFCLKKKTHMHLRSALCAQRKLNQGIDHLRPAVTLHPALMAAD